jgi:hypothetical protein
VPSLSPFCVDSKKFYWSNMPNNIMKDCFMLDLVLSCLGCTLYAAAFLVFGFCLKCDFYSIFRRTLMFSFQITKTIVPAHALMFLNFPVNLNLICKIR